jgi:hypothetical protein
LLPTPAQRYESGSSDHATTIQRNSYARCGCLGFAEPFIQTVSGVLSYSSRPERPKPWNSKAIIATFDVPGVEGEATSKTLLLLYTLENTTGSDYRMPKKDQLEIDGRLRRENSLDFGGAAITIDEDEAFLPAKQRKRFTIHLAYSVKADIGPPPQTKEEYRHQQQVLAEAIKKDLSNLNGFVIFDLVNRYEIDFPNGWDDIEHK